MSYSYHKYLKAITHFIHLYIQKHGEKPKGLIVSKNIVDGILNEIYITSPSTEKRNTLYGIPFLTVAEDNYILTLNVAPEPVQWLTKIIPDADESHPRPVETPRPLPLVPEHPQ